MAEDFKMGAAFVELYLKDPTDADETRVRKGIESRLSKTPPRVSIRLAPVTVGAVSEWRKDAAASLAKDRPKVGVDLAGITGVAADKVRKEIEEKVGEPTPKVPVKVDVDRKSTLSTRKKLIRLAVGAAGILGPAGVIGGAVLGTAGLIGGLGIAAVHADTEVTTAFGHLRDTVVTDTRTLAAPIAPVLAGIATQTESTFTAMEGDIGSAFQTVAPEIDDIARGMLNLAREALPGLTGAIKASGPVVSTISADLGGLGHSVTGFLTGLSSGAPGAAEGIHAILVDVETLLPPLGHFIGSTAILTGTLLHDLTPAIHAAGVVLDGFAGFVDHTSSVLGPLGAGALTVLAAFKTWTVISRLSASAQLGIAAVTTKLRGEAAVAGEATVANSAFTKSVGLVGRGVGILAAAAIIALPAISALNRAEADTGNIDKFTKGLLAGGDALKGVSGQLRQYAEGAAGIAGDDRFAKSLSTTKQNLDDQLVSLGATNTQISAVNTAYDRYVTVAGNVKSSSGDVRDALKDLRGSITDAKTDTDGLDLSVQGLDTDLRGIITTSQALSQELDRQKGVQDAFAADIALRQAQDSTAAAQKNLNDTMAAAGHTAADVKQATDGLLASMQAQAQAASDAAQANYTGTDAAGKAAAGAAAYRQTLVALSQHASGPLKDALLGTIKRLDDAAKPRVTDLKADISNAEAGIKTAEDKLKTIPKSKQAAIKADIADLLNKAAKARAELNSIQSKTVRIGVNLVTTGPSGIQVGSVKFGIKAFAEGGVVPPRPGGELIRVAEAGVPEAVIPLDQRGARFVQRTLGANTPAGALAGASSGPPPGTTVVNNYYITMHVSADEIDSAVRLARMLEQLPQTARAGGAFV